MPNEDLAFGIDLSKYNTSQDGKQKPDFDIIAANEPEVVFIAMRAGISWGYQDPWFNYYMQEAERIKRVRLAYHVLYPGQPAGAQMDNFFRILGDLDFSKVPLVLDLELHHNQTVSTITQCTADSVRIITNRTGRIPFIYSRANWINQHVKVSALPPVHWWLAQYRYAWPYPLYTPEYTCPPDLPLGVKAWTVQQTASRGKSIGAKAMHYMDHNRWNGTKADVLSFVGEKPILPITCPIDDQPCCRLQQLHAAALKECSSSKPYAWVTRPRRKRKAKTSCQTLSQGARRATQSLKRSATPEAAKSPKRKRSGKRRGLTQELCGVMYTDDKQNIKRICHCEDVPKGRRSNPSIGLKIDSLLHGYTSHQFGRSSFYYSVDVWRKVEIASLLIALAMTRLFYFWRCT